MKRAYFRFYAELNDFLPPPARANRLEYAFQGNPSVKDAIEALGVPHTEVDLILVNGVSVDFTHRLKDLDEVSIYPVFESMDISEVLQVRPQPLRVTRFVADVHLGRLAAYLRLAGFDTEYRNDCDDAELARISKNDRRILLTRDRGLLKRSEVTHGYCVRETNPRLQLREVLQRFDLWNGLAPFSRCLRCNAELRQVPKEEILSRLPPRVRQEQEEFHTCPICGRLFWRGSHYHKLNALLAGARKGPAGE